MNSISMLNLIRFSNDVSPAVDSPLIVAENGFPLRIQATVVPSFRISPLLPIQSEIVSERVFNDSHEELLLNADAVRITLSPNPAVSLEYMIYGNDASFGTEFSSYAGMLKLEKNE